MIIDEDVLSNYVTFVLFKLSLGKKKSRVRNRILVVFQLKLSDSREYSEAQLSRFTLIQTYTNCLHKRFAYALVSVMIINLRNEIDSRIR